MHELHEFNPMLGFRGCRLGIKYPEISEMQARAIFQAAAAVLKEGIKVKPEIMIPLVGFKKELDLQVEIVHRVAQEVMKETGKKFPYSVGTMIEVPRGALTADEIAETAEFFSFGTNDLTQTCLGMSRDDSGSFLPSYQTLEIIKANPFASIDTTGVGQLMKIGVDKGRKHQARPEDRHLRRTRRRPLVRHVLPPDRPELRQLLAVPRAHRPPRRGPGGAEEVASAKHRGFGYHHRPARHSRVGVTFVVSLGNLSSRFPIGCVG